MTAKSVIRTLRPTHLVALRAFDSRSSVTELTAPSWPRVSADECSPPLWSLFAHSMAHSTGRRRVWAYFDPDGIRGLIVARVRCDGLVWDVHHLWVDGADESVAESLLAWLCAEAANRGARRVFLELGTDTEERALARRAGFDQYTEATLHRFVGDGRPPAAALAGARTRRRGDELPLFQLYSAAVPLPVRAAEAMTLEEWQALYKGARRWTPGLLSNRQQQVWQWGDTAIAWLEMAYGAKSQHAEWLVHPDHEEACDGLAAQALQLAGGKLPLYATSRVYQPALASALSRAGFVPVAERSVFVRQLAVRIPERALIAVSARPTVGG
jgi:hypothetical protein